MVADFADRGIRLHKERGSLTWAEFRDILTGLLGVDSRLSRHISQKKREADDDE